MKRVIAAVKNRLGPKSVDSCLCKVVESVASLEKAQREHQHVAMAKLAAADTLYAQAELASDEAQRAERVASRIKAIVE